MQRKTFSLLALLLFSAATSHGQQALATLASVQGQVSVKSAASSRWEKAENKTALRVGDSVRTGAKSSVKLLYANGSEIHLTSNQKHVVGARAEAASLPERVLAAIQIFFEPPAALTQGARRGADKPPAMLYPRKGKILSNTPTFAWLSSAPGTVYHLKLVRDTGTICRILGNDLWEKTTRDTVMTFPQAEPALLASQNYWVEIKRETSGHFEDYACFTVAEAGQRTELEALRQQLRARYGSTDPNDVTFALMYAALLRHEEFFTEALVVVQEALRKQPKNPTLRALQKRIYADTEMPF